MLVIFLDASLGSGATFVVKNQEVLGCLLIYRVVTKSRRERRAIVELAQAIPAPTRSAHIRFQNFGVARHGHR